MTTGSLCLTEILKSWKSCSSKSEASHTADSTSASGVALPYFSITRLSSEPALTPIRMEVPLSLAACAISFTWSSNLRMLPGLTRTPAQPASMAAKTYFGWKWMSAITGICDLRAIAGSASASSWLGQATRTMSHPAAVSSAICCRVALTSDVRVVVIDCTLIGASDPTATLPTLIWRVLRRGARTGGGSAGSPRLTVTPSVSRYGTISTRRTRTQRSMGPASQGSAEVHGVDDVGVDEQHRHADEQARDAVCDRQRSGDVHRAGIGPVAPPGDLPAAPLPQRSRHVAAVKGQQRDEVEHEERDVEARDEREQRDEPVD